MEIKNNHPVKSDFDRIIDYDSKRDHYYFTRRLERLLVVLPQNKSVNILDFGGGSGLFSFELLRRGYHNIYLVDNSEVQIRQAKEKGLRNILCSDQNNLPFENNFFDFVLMLDLIEHLNDPCGSLVKMHRIMKPDSVLFLSFPNPRWVPLLNFFGEIGLKLKGRDNKIYYQELKKNLEHLFSFEVLEGHMFMSKLPKTILKLGEHIENFIPQTIKRAICILNILILTKK